MSLKLDSHFAPPPKKKKKIVLFTSMKAFLKAMKNAFISPWKFFFVLKIFKILSWLFDHVEKTAWLER